MYVRTDCTLAHTRTGESAAQREGGDTVYGSPFGCERSLRKEFPSAHAAPSTADGGSATRELDSAGSEAKGCVHEPGSTCKQLGEQTVLEEHQRQRRAIAGLQMEAARIRECREEEAEEEGQDIPADFQGYPADAGRGREDAGAADRAGQRGGRGEEDPGRQGGAGEEIARSHGDDGRQRVPEMLKAMGAKQIY